MIRLWAYPCAHTWPCCTPTPDPLQSSTPRPGSHHTRPSQGATQRFTLALYLTRLHVVWSFLWGVVVGNTHTRGLTPRPHCLSCPGSRSRGFPASDCCSHVICVHCMPRCYVLWTLRATPGHYRCYQQRNLSPPSHTEPQSLIQATSQKDPSSA